MARDGIAVAIQKVGETKGRHEHEKDEIRTMAAAAISGSAIPYSTSQPQHTSKSESEGNECTERRADDLA